MQSFNCKVCTLHNGTCGLSLDYFRSWQKGKACQTQMFCSRRIHCVKLTFHQKHGALSLKPKLYTFLKPLKSEDDETGHNLSGEKLVCTHTLFIRYTISLIPTSPLDFISINFSFCTR